MSQVTEFRGRGIQESDVFAAADALLIDGQRPTIERVRLKIGRGSPNTVSPMLDRWFATLGSRLVSHESGHAKPAGNDSDGMPVGVRNAAKLLWETARREAEELQREAAAAERLALQAEQVQLAEAQRALAQREDAFSQARVSLDAALASSQQATQTLERQLKDHAIEAHRVRVGLEDEIQRLSALLAQAGDAQERLRRDHAAALAVKDEDLRQAEARHVGQEKRMLEEIDRARQAAKHAETTALKEQQRRLQSEEAAAQTLEVGRRMLRETQQAAQHLERALREELATQAAGLAKANSECEALKERGRELDARLQEEKAAHDATRGLLGEALSMAKARERSKSARPVSKLGKKVAQGD